jgi:hypothetical protein
MFTPSNSTSSVAKKIKNFAQAQKLSGILIP